MSEQHVSDYPQTHPGQHKVDDFEPQSNDLSSAFDDLQRGGSNKGSAGGKRGLNPSSEAGPDKENDARNIAGIKDEEENLAAGSSSKALSVRVRAVTEIKR